MNFRVLRRLRWDRLGLLLGGVCAMGLGMMSFVSAGEEEETAEVVLAHPGRVEMPAAGMNPELKREPKREPEPETGGEEILPCACNKNVVKLPRNPYTAHRQAARSLPNSFFVKDNAELKAGNRRGKLVDIRDGRGYHLAPMRDSHLMLLPEVRDVLVEIGHAFADKLEGTPSEGTRLRITSLTRTDEQQRRLSKRNYNAIDESTHSYGASFDIAFMDRPDNDANCGLPTRAVNEVLKEFQDAGRIYVMPEGICMHITLRRVD